MNPVLDKLTQAILVHVDASRLSVMDLALNNRWVGSSFHLESRNSIIVYVILLKISLKVNGSVRNGD